MSLYPNTAKYSLDQKFQIKKLQPDDYKRWDDFVLNVSSGSFCHLSGWLQMYEKIFKYKTFYYYVEELGEIKAILPLARVKSVLFGDALISSPHCVYGGPLGEPKYKQELVYYVKAIAKSLGVDYIELRCTDDWLQEGILQPLYVGFKNTISLDPEENLAAIPRKQRRIIRNSLKSSLSYNTDLDIKTFYKLYSESVRNLGTPVLPFKYFAAFEKFFGDKVTLLTVKNGQRAVASVLSFIYKNEILPYYGGGSSWARNLNANDYMYFQLMNYAAEHNLTEFDYGRSKVDSGSYRFKKHWGFEPKPLNYRYILINAKQAPDLNPTNKKYKHLIKAWKKLPLKVSQRIGPYIARRIG